ncbi:MAG: GNAT family N-acetyltransferase [Acidobacteriota bacterium]|nr:GNAT family N-acetyltransferase [Acidobacteriota bacterium]
MLEIVETTPSLIPIARELFLEYANSLDFSLSFQSFNEELASLPGEYAPPRGFILLALKDSEAAGCVAMRPLDSSVAEMKRLYVRQRYQGSRIGRMLVSELVERATRIGYRKIRLDTVPSMKAAINLYLSMGFYPIAPYRENPIPGTAYLEKDLRS